MLKWVIELDNLIPTKKFHCYLNPERKVLKGLKFTDIQMNFYQIKKFYEIVDDFLNFIKDKRLVIHNAEFDLSHINNELKKLGKN